MPSIDEKLDSLIMYLRGYRQILKAPNTAGLDSRDELEDKIKPLFVDLMGYGAALKDKEEEEKHKIDERLRTLLNQRIAEKTIEEGHKAIKDEVAGLRRVIKALPKINPGEREIKANLRLLEKEVEKVNRSVKDLSRKPMDVSFVEALKGLSRKQVNVNLAESETMNEIKRLRKQLVPSEGETDNIYIVYPSAGGKKTVSTGTLVIDFLMGEVTLSDGSIEHTSNRLENTDFEEVKSLSVNTNKDVTISLDNGGKYEVERNQRFSTTQPFRIIYIECTEKTEINVFASTNEEEALKVSRPTTMDVDDRRFTTSIEYNVDGNPVYVGDAEAGAGKSEKKWRVKKLIYLGNDVTDIQWAEGSTSFNFAWDDRGSYDYS